MSGVVVEFVQGPWDGRLLEITSELFNLGRIEMESHPSEHDTEFHEPMKRGQVVYRRRSGTLKFDYQGKA